MQKIEEDFQVSSSILKNSYTIHEAYLSDKLIGWYEGILYIPFYSDVYVMDAEANHADNCCRYISPSFIVGRGALKIRMMNTDRA